MAGDDLRYARAIGTDEPLGKVSGSKIFQCFDPYQGSFVMLAKPFWDGDDGALHYLIDNYGASANAKGILKRDNNSLVDDDLLCSIVVDSTSFPAGAFHHILWVYDANNTIDGTNYRGLFLDVATSSKKTNLPTTSLAPSFTQIGAIGSNQANQANGILYFAILNTALPSYLLFDDFADQQFVSGNRLSGNPGYPGWVAGGTGSFFATNQRLEGSAPGDGAYAPEVTTSYSGAFDDIALEFKVSHGGDNATSSYYRVMRLQDSASGKY